MPKLKTIWDEIVGLFVDDQLFAVAILAWLAFVWLIITHVSMAPVWRAIALFAGLAVILAESATRAARR